MAPPTRRISKEEWKRHEGTIHDLYYDRGLPLKSTEGGPSVQQIMRDEHQFFASAAQYEAHFRQSGNSKYAKREEWIAIHSKLRELEDAKIEYQVKFLGQPLTRDRVARSRRYASAALPPILTTVFKLISLTGPSRLSIEIRDRTTGEWTMYRGDGNCTDNDSPPLFNEDIAAETSELLAPNGSRDLPFDGREPSSISTPSFGNEAAAQEFDQSFALINSSGEFIVSSDNIPPFPDLSFGEVAFHGSHSPIRSPRDPLQFLSFTSSFQFNQLSRQISPSRLHEHSPRWRSVDIAPLWLSNSDTTMLPQPSIVRFDSYTPIETPFYQLRNTVLSKKRSPHSIWQYPFERALERSTTSQTIVSRTSSRVLVQSLLKEAAQVLTTNSIPGEGQLPDPESLLESLLSLLPDPPQRTNLEKMGAVGTRDVVFDSPFYSALLFSIANGFAGLQDMPAGAIIGMLKNQPQIRSQFFECIQSCPPALAKPLAENLFRAAVEALDEDAITIILNVTKNSPYAIDPNLIACEIFGEDRLYTPVELAAKLRHFGVVRCLLAAKADVNKTYLDRYQDDELGRGALELAIRETGEFETVSMDLVQALLNCHAIVRADLVDAGVRRGNAELVQELILRFPPFDHRALFGIHQDHHGHYEFVAGLNKQITTIERIAALQDDRAAQIIEQILEYCRSEQCNKCPEMSQLQFQEALWQATARADLSLVHLLLPYVSDDFSALSAAVKSGNRTLIDLMLRRGLGLGEPARDSRPRHLHYSGKRTIYTTPLAEAIRSRDEGIVKEFEQLGALAYLAGSAHFMAAVRAAAEVDDSAYLQSLLDLHPEKRGMRLSDALEVAICNDHTALAIKLIDAGADVNPGDSSVDMLLVALKRQNRAAVDKLLEADVDLSGYRNSAMLEAAVHWGDTRVIEDLILMGVDFNNSECVSKSLIMAVKSRNANLVRLLLDNAERSGLSGSRLEGPLEAACKNNDERMVRLLLSSSASQLEPEALFWARENNRPLFNILCELFASPCTHRNQYDGPALLIRAIEEEANDLIEIILRGKPDMNKTFERKRNMDRNRNMERTPLATAILQRNGSALELVQKLIRAGGDPNSIVQRSQYKFGHDAWPLDTALLVAVGTKSEKMVELLLENGADVNRPARRGVKRTPLQRACEIGSHKIAKLLLDKKADVNAAPAYRGGGTALQLAAISGSIKIVLLLISRGASLHADPSKLHGRTALEGAAEHGRLDMIKVLWDVASGERFSPQERFKPQEIESAMTLARDQGHTSCANYIAYLSGRSDLFLLEDDLRNSFESWW